MLKFYSESDRGVLAVGIIGQFIIDIPNLYGDGITEVIVLDQDEDLPYKAKFFSTICGDQINIYSYDCWVDDQEILTTLSGSYCCYNFETYDHGVVIFRKYVS